ncbi:MAG: PEP-CTERM sorting domain-containing protein [Terrimicrobiaceae bacterium]|nr:PEP-CTERM sorting domain-containing protein [Terrimicrobiaceae bacterium]
MNWFKRLVGVVLVTPLCIAMATQDSGRSWDQRGATWASWEGSQLRVSAGEWIWSPQQVGEPVAAMVLGAGTPYVIFTGAFEQDAQSFVPKLRRVAGSWLPLNRGMTGAFERVTESTVPEPGTWIMIGVGAAFALWNSRRRRRTA